MAAEKPFQFVRAGKLHFFCPLCHYHQSTSTIERIRWYHHLQLGVLTLAFTLLAFPVFGWSGLWLYLLFWMGFEFFYRLRKRQALVCESCGFDPFLYKQDVERARRALRDHWQNRIEKEKLFAGKKLRNYQTAPVKEEPVQLPDGASTSAEDKKNSPSPGTNTP